MTLDTLNLIDVCSHSIETLNTRIDFFHSVIS